jgi:hypothetical protein
MLYGEIAELAAIKATAVSISGAAVFLQAPDAYRLRYLLSGRRSRSLGCKLAEASGTLHFYLVPRLRRHGLLSPLLHSPNTSCWE